MSDIASAPEGERRNGDAEILQRIVAVSRRVDDVALTVNGLVTRVHVLEEGSAQSTDELRANTRLTLQVHEAVFGREEKPGLRDAVDDLKATANDVHGALFGLGGDDVGVKAKIDKVHSVYSDAERGFAFLNRLADTAARWSKPALYVGGLIGALVLYAKTGEWKWPTF